MLLYAFNYFSKVVASKAKAKKDPILVYAPTSPPATYHQSPKFWKQCWISLD